MLRPTLQAANHPLLVRVHYTDAMLPSLAKRLAVCVSPKPGLGPMRSPAFARCKARPRWSDGDSPAAWWWADAQRRLLDACRTLGRNAHRAGCHQRTTHSVTLMRLQPYIRSWDGPTGTGPPWAWRWATVGMALGHCRHGTGQPYAHGMADGHWGCRRLDAFGKDATVQQVGRTPASTSVFHASR